MEEEKEGLLGWGGGETEAFHGICWCFSPPAESPFSVVLRCADPPCTDSGRTLHDGWTCRLAPPPPSPTPSRLPPSDPERSKSIIRGQLLLNKLYSS